MPLRSPCGYRGASVRAVLALRNERPAMDGDWQRGDLQMCSHYAAVHEAEIGTERPRANARFPRRRWRIGKPPARATTRRISPCASRPMRRRYGPTNLCPSIRCFRRKSRKLLEGAQKRRAPGAGAPLRNWRAQVVRTQALVAHPARGIRVRLTQPKMPTMTRGSGWTGCRAGSRGKRSGDLNISKPARTTVDKLSSAT